MPLGVEVMRSPFRPVAVTVSVAVCGGGGGGGPGRLAAAIAKGDIYSANYELVAQRSRAPPARTGRRAGAGPRRHAGFRSAESRRYSREKKRDDRDASNDEGQHTYGLPAGSA